MRNEEHPYLAFIIKPTYDCNLKCKYCSVYGHKSADRMTRETVDTIFERAVDFCGTDRAICFIWHGGEPLLMGAEFYDYVGQKTKTYKSLRIINTIQSNATLMNDEIMHVIINHKFKFSTSLDGPPAIHNRSRRDRSGATSIDHTLASLQRMREHDIQVGAITVLNKLNIDSMPELYRFFSNSDIHVRLNPVLFHGKAAQDFEDVAISPAQYSRAMIEIFDLWYRDPEPRIMVEPFRIIIGNIVSGYNECCGFRRQCHREVISVSPKGDVYPCGQFNEDKDYYLGNIKQHNLAEIMASTSMKRLLSRTPQNITQCGNCPYVELCNCGCTASAVCRNGDIMQPDYYCAGRKQIFQHILDALEKDIKKTRHISKTLKKNFAI